MGAFLADLGPEPVDARPAWDEALRRTGLLDLLAGHDPRVIGTPPLGLDLPESDIDLVARAVDPARLAVRLWPDLSGFAAVHLHQWSDRGRPLIIRLVAHGWPIEIFASPQSVDEQPGWRHFAVERRLLALGGEELRAAVRAQRGAGLKTEPAFAAVLGLAGDPYAAILHLHERSDAELMKLLAGPGASQMNDSSLISVGAPK